MEGQVCTLKTVQFLGVHLKEGAVDELVAARARLRVNVQHLLHECPDIGRVVIRNPRVNAFAHALVQVVHVTPTEGRLQGEHLVDDAAERPDVGLVTVRLIFPNLW